MDIKGFKQNSVNGGFKVCIKMYIYIFYPSISCYLLDLIWDFLYWN